MLQIAPVSNVTKASQFFTMDNANILHAILAPSFEDVQDFTNANRGFIAALTPCIIKDTAGNTVWNNDEYNFVYETCPDTVNPKLWRQSQILSKQGLYQISPSIYQVRGFDISHITFVEGKTGIIVIDPLISCECAAAALRLYHSHRGNRPVKGMIYSHSHADHFGGAAGIISVARGRRAEIPIIAPEGFLEEATSENVFAGPIMRYRAKHMYGSNLPKSPVGQIGVGLGMGTSSGTLSLIPPTVTIDHTGQTVEIDGVKITFQMVPNTEAPAEMNMYFPHENALLIAECATHSLHNIVTLRGALVRDAKSWSRYLDESLHLYGEIAGATVLFASHGWPTWGKEDIKTFLEEQRDMYSFLHDQTLRLMNEGFNGAEIAEMLTLPPKLKQAWHAQEFYGSVSHNVKGIYQRYMTWFDGLAENLWKWPPREEGERYLKCMGGAGPVLERAKRFMQDGDFRFAATLLGHVLAAEDSVPDDLMHQCRTTMATVFEHLGFGAENATWRNYYLSQAQDLRNGKRSKKVQRQNRLAELSPHLPIQDWLAVLSININGQEAGKERGAITVSLDIADQRECWRLILSNGALTYRLCSGFQQLAANRDDAALRLEKGELQDILANRGSRYAHLVSGEVQALNRILSYAGIGPVSKQPAGNL